MLVNLLNKLNWQQRVIDIVKGAVFLCVVYVFIFLLYAFHKKTIVPEREPKGPISKELNYLVLRGADYKYLLEMQKRKIKPNTYILAEYEDYFLKVVNSVADQADSYGMLGYCQYFLGKEEEAIKSLESAIEINPTFFGYYYNLAVISYNRKEYLKAVIMLQKGLSVPMPLTVQTILFSQRIYLPILEQLPGSYPQKIVDYLEEEKQKALGLLKLSMEGLRNNNLPVENEKKLIQLL